MMPQHRRIPIPFSKRLDHVRRSFLPIIVFALSALGVIGLWERQTEFATAIGRVEVIRVDVASGTQGFLASHSVGPWNLLSKVDANELVAQIDETPIVAEIATLRAQLAKLRREAEATAEKVLFESAIKATDAERDRIRIELESRRISQERKLDVLDRRTKIEEDRIEAKRVQASVAYLNSLRSTGSVTEIQAADEKARLDIIEKRIQDNLRALAEAEQQLLQTSNEAAPFSSQPEADITKLTAPIEAEIEVVMRRLDELNIKVQMRNVIAPIKGTICAIHAWPGQYLQPGMPILTIASDEGRHVVSYLRQDQRIQVEQGTLVKLRVKGSRAPLVDSMVEQVGSQFEPVPQPQQRDPLVAEWGVPITIRLPSGLQIRPGELVEIVFRRAQPPKT